MISNLTPVIKWVGGKTQLLSKIIPLLPTEYNTYYEPFIGGGAVLFSIQPNKAVINDINPQLINLYSQIKNKDSVYSLIEQIKEYDSIPCNKDYYLSLREVFNKKIENRELDVECSALFIWINKHCFNGLYRVNSKGLFNVPYNNKISGCSIDEDNILGIHNYLNDENNQIELTNSDFESVCNKAQNNDFIYFDSPYFPESITADFTSYSKEGFGLKEHERLNRLYKELSSRGVKMMLSNNDVEWVRDNYSEFRIIPIEAKRMVNRDGSKRNNGKEVLILNY